MVEGAPTHEQGSLSDFQSVNHRNFIPREGINPGKINLSAGSPYPEGLERSFGTQDEELSVWDLQLDWAKSREEIYHGCYSAISPLLAAAPNSDSLYEKYIVPQIMKHVKPGKNVMLVPEIGYPLPVWNMDKLPNVQMMEGRREEGEIEWKSFEPQLYRYIKQGIQLPPEVGVVYMDIPSTVLNMPLSRQQIITWVNNHPDVLFIFDQANQGFSRTMGELFETDLSLTRLIKGPSTFDSNTHVLITNTTTKRQGRSGFAWCQGTSPFSSGGSIEYIGFSDDDPKSIDDAVSALTIDVAHKPSVLSSSTFGKDFRGGVSYHKEDFVEALSELELNDLMKIFPFGTNESPHVIIDVTQLNLGFDRAQELVDYLQKFDIAIKPATYYGDVTKFRELTKLAYISIPAKSEDLAVLMEAFRARKRDMLQ